MKTRVWILDDHQAVCTLLAGFVDSLADFTVVAHTADLAATRTALERQEIDVLVLDLHLGTESGTTLFTGLAADIARPRIVIHSGDISLRALELTSQLGADCFVAKGDPIECFAEALQRAREGRTYYSPTVVTLITRCRMANLTPADIELAQLLLTQDHRGQLAAALNVSRPTLARRLNRLFRKLQISSPRDVVRRAAEHGLIPFDLASPEPAHPPRPPSGLPIV